MTALGETYDGVEDFGLVQRAACACSGVIIVASNARRGLVEAALVRHAGTIEHRRYYGLDAPYDHHSEAPSTPLSVPDAHRSELTTRGAQTVRGERSLGPDPRDGVSIRRDGYDFRVRRDE